MIRPAIPEDIERLLEMGAAFNVEAGYADSVPFDRESFARTLVTLGRAELLLVATDGNRAVGMAGADVAPSICNQNVKFGREAFWFVDPEHRKGTGRKLLAALELAARNYGAQYFDAIAETGKRSDALARMYRAGGYRPCETTFRKVLSEKVL